MAAYRILSDGLRSVVDHGGAHRASALVRRSASELELRLEADGPLSPAAYAGLRERTLLFGGTLASSGTRPTAAACCTSSCRSTRRPPMSRLIAAARRLGVAVPDVVIVVLLMVIGVIDTTVDPATDLGPHPWIVVVGMTLAPLPLLVMRRHPTSAMLGVAAVLLSVHLLTVDIKELFTPMVTLVVAAFAVGAYARPADLLARRAPARARHLRRRHGGHGAGDERLHLPLPGVPDRLVRRPARARSRAGRRAPRAADRAARARARGARARRRRARARPDRARAARRRRPQRLA